MNVIRFDLDDSLSASRRISQLGIFQTVPRQRRQFGKLTVLFWFVCVGSLIRVIAYTALIQCDSLRTVLK